MSGAAVLAAALTDHSTRSRILTVGGVDVIVQPGTGANRLGTPIESIRVSERGHEGVSSMSFVVEDVNLVFDVQDGMEVQYINPSASLPTDNFTFRGWVDHWDQEPTNPGRVFTISAIGPEALLDWAMLLTDLVLPSGMTALDAIQSVAANAYGRGPMRFGAAAAGSSNTSNPVSSNLSGFTLGAALTITAGTSMREALRLVLVAANAASSLTVGTYVCTVDFFLGLRVFLISMGLFPAGLISDVVDWNGTGSITDTSASGTLGATQDLHYVTEGATVRAVFVSGANAAGTGLVTDGTGLLGATAYITNTTSDSAARLALVGQSYLASYTQKQRASATLGPLLPSLLAGVHPGETFGRVVDVSYANIDPSGRIPPTEIMQIDKEFFGGGLESWTFAFGGFPASGTNLMRRFTAQPRA